MDRRQSERVSRERRLARMQDMRDEIRVLSNVALTLPLLTDADEIWDEFLDAEAKRIRDELRRLAPAVEAASALLHEKEELVRLLKAHQLAAKAIQTLRENLSKDDWIDDVRRWKALARVAFTPWSMDDCLLGVEAAVRDMRQEIAQADTLTMEPGFVGWEMSRRRSSDACRLHFLMRKTFHQIDLDNNVNLAWRAFNDPTIFMHVLHGDKGRASLDVLQELSPTMKIVHIQEQSNELATTFHSLLLIARFEGADGVTQIVRSVPTPTGLQTLGGPCDSWTSNNIWFQWQIIDNTKPRACTDFHVTFGGSLGADDQWYAQRWQLGVVSATVQTETLMSGTALVDLATD